VATSYLTSPPLSSLASPYLHPLLTGGPGSILQMLVGVLVHFGYENDTLLRLVFCPSTS